MYSGRPTSLLLLLLSNKIIILLETCLKGLLTTSRRASNYLLNKGLDDVRFREEKLVENAEVDNVQKMILDVALISELRVLLSNVCPQVK